MKIFYKCRKCSSVYNNDFTFCEKCLNYDDIEILEIEKQEITDDMSIQEFIKLAEPIPYYESGNNIIYIWDNQDEYKKILENEKLHVYTVIDADNKLWIHNGLRWSNRIGYIFSENYVEILEGIEY